MLLLRVGERRQGVIGLYQPGLTGEQSPGLSVRFMGISRNAIASYLDLPVLLARRAHAAMRSPCSKTSKSASSMSTPTPTGDGVSGAPPWVPDEATLTRLG